MRLPDFTPLASPEAPRTVGELLGWCRGLVTFIKRLTDRHNETIRALHQVAEGHGHLRGSVTLTAGATTTVVTAERMPAEAVPLLTAGSGTWTSTALRVSAKAAGQFTITHSNEAATDRVVHWMVPTPG